eukprot:gene2812-biopygen2750
MERVRLCSSSPGGLGSGGGRYGTHKIVVTAKTEELEQVFGVTLGARVLSSFRRVGDMGGIIGSERRAPGWGEVGDSEVEVIGDDGLEGEAEFRETSGVGRLVCEHHHPSGKVGGGVASFHTEVEEEPFGVCNEVTEAVRGVEGLEFGVYCMEKAACGGCFEEAETMLKALLGAVPSRCALRVDWKNAFNTVHRRAIYRVMFEDFPELLGMMESLGRGIDGEYHWPVLQDILREQPEVHVIAYLDDPHILRELGHVRAAYDMGVPLLVDIGLELNGRHLILDVVVGFPCALSFVERVSQEPLHTASVDDRQKVGEVRAAVGEWAEVDQAVVDWEEMDRAEAERAEGD